MTSVFDDSPIELTCPECGHQFSELIGKLKTNPDLTCSGCGVTIQIDSKGLNAGLRKADDALSDLDRAIGRLNKKIKF